MTEEILLFFENNYAWLIPAFFSFICLVITFFKKGSLKNDDVKKIMESEKVIASALTVLMEKEKKKNEISSKEKSEETQKNS